MSEHGLEIISSELSDEFLRFFVSYSKNKNEQLKIEFAKDVPPMMSPVKTYGRIIVDSFEDISVNKICAILNREPPESKDFVDLFFILKHSEYSVDYLLERAKEKEVALDDDYGILGFATNLFRVGELQFLPRMIKPITLDDLSSRLTPIAQNLINRLRP